MSLIGKTNEEKIWNFFSSKGLNDYGCAGLLGNLYCESGLDPKNLENTGNTKLKMTDDEYVKAVDNGKYTKEKFIKDGFGFGLPQFTFYTLKKGLYDYAKSQNKSIGNLETQLNYLYKELSTNYKSVWSTLKTATSVLQASNVVLLKFERPADQSTSVQNKRASYGQKYYDKYAKSKTTSEIKTVNFKMRTTKPEAGNKYYITKANGGWSPCVKGKPTDPDCDVLSNCVGFAVGRFNEIGGYESCKYLKSTNAENFIQYKDSSLKVGQTPKLGACMVWQKGKTLSGSDGAGHVAIVENVISNTEVYTSESGYGASKPFWNQTRKKGSGNWGQNSDYKFLGFIYNPAVTDITSTTDYKNIANSTVNISNNTSVAKSFSKSLAGTYITTANLNLRKGAGTSNAIITTIPKGDKVTCYGYYTYLNNVKWYYVIYTNNKKSTYNGFVSSQYLKK